MAKSNNFVERSLVAALRFLKESVLSDEYALKKAFLQLLDARIKVIIFLLFITAVIFTKSIIVCTCLYLLCLVLAYFSKVNIGFFLKRTWIFIPLFSVFIAIPAIFNIFTPGEALFFINILGLKLIVTRQGLFGATLFVIRVVASVSFAVLLSITTKHFELLRVLKIFKIPQVFVMVLGMCYRYIFLFAEIVEKTFLAINSRVGTRIDYKKGQHIVAWNIASLWYRAYHLNEAVYNAMLSRGYNGEPIILDDFKSNFKDWLCLVFSVILFIIVLYLGSKLT